MRGADWDLKFPNRAVRAGVVFRALTYPPPEVDYHRKRLRERRRALEAAEEAVAAFRDDERIEDILGRDQFVLGLRIRAMQVEDARRALAFAESASRLRRSRRYVRCAAIGWTCLFRSGGCTSRV